MDDANAEEPIVIASVVNSNARFMSVSFYTLVRKIIKYNILESTIDLSTSHQ